MAKFAIVFLAALAFQAASAGVYRYEQYQKYPENTLGQYEYGLQYHGYPTGKFDVLFGELQTVSQELTAYFQRALPNDRLVLKTLIWQSRELAQYIDTIIEKLQAETYRNNGQVSIVLEQFISELRDVQVQYQQIAAYTTDAYAVDQIKNQFHMTVQRTVAQLEKLVHFVQTSFEQTHGDLYFIIKNVVADFLYAFHNIYSHVQYYGVYAEQSPRQLVLQIEEVTKYLTGYSQGVTHFDAHRMHAVREYVEHVEAIFQRIQEVEGTYGNLEIDAAFQQVYSKIHRVHATFAQIFDAEHLENVEAIRSQLIEELLFVAQAFEQFVQYAHVGQYQTFYYEILGDYLYAIQKFRMQMQSGYQTYYYQRGFYGNNEFPDFYAKYGFQGLYQPAGLYAKTGYQGLYRYGGYGYGFSGKYQQYAKYGQDLKQFQIQIQTIVRDLYQAFNTVSFEDVTARQTFVHLVREYVHQLEFIVERLNHYVQYNAETVIFQQVAQNLRQYVLTLETFYTTENSVVEFKTQFYMYVQKIASEFEKLAYEVEQTQGSFYEIVHNVLYQYLTATYNLYKNIENVHEISHYGYEAYARQSYGDNYFGGKYQGQQVYETPKELVNQIQSVARDLSATFQNGMFFNQQHAQLLSVNARRFTLIIKNVVDQLEAYEHVDATIQQVIYKLREVQHSFQQLAALNVFTNVHQFRAQFDSYVQTAIAQIERLLLIGQEETYGNFYYVMKDALHFFLDGLHEIRSEFEQVTQYGKVHGYDYAGKYGSGFARYGFNKKGQQEYIFAKYGIGKDGQEYGFVKFGFGKYQPKEEQDNTKYAQFGQYGKGYENVYQHQSDGYQQVPYGKYLASAEYNQNAIRAY